MGHGMRHAAAAVIAASTLLAAAWAGTAYAGGNNRDACHEAIRLTEAMAEKNGEMIGTMAARSVSLRLGHTADVERLTPLLHARQAEYQSLHLAFREAAANC